MLAGMPVSRSICDALSMWGVRVPDIHVHSTERATPRCRANAARDIALAVSQQATRFPAGQSDM